MKYFFIISFLFGLTSLAQDDTSARVKNDYSAFKANLSGAWIFNNVTNNVNGNVYLFENWNTYGIIRTNTNQNLVLSGLNYDTKTDSFVAKVSEDSVYVFNNADIKEIIINKKLFKSYLNLGEPSYYEVLATSNNIEILKKHEKILKKGMVDPLTQKASPDKYIDKYSYFSFKDGKIEELKLSIKPFTNIFGEKSEDIKKYISKNNFSIKEDKNFQAILNYYNTL